ncbi:hypothetical protein [Butyricicoccus pullicaecorum]|uniref:hypothetical protein n=1 Tax=Butyricicoccus pullicaecorum TaxID=501571 RepID=UPI00116083DA|nr:hypothetical protein [Butyricicoccus pullicaecorum]
MNDYISLNHAATAFSFQTIYSYSDCLQMLIHAVNRGWIASITDAAPVVHSRWIEEVYIDPYGADWKKYRCSLCGRVEIIKEPYCNCGAKMDLD